MIWIGGLTFRELRGNAAARAPSDEGQSRHFLRGSINCSRDVGTQIREPPLTTVCYMVTKVFRPHFTCLLECTRVNNRL